MSTQTIQRFLEQDERKELLRLSTAGSIDDGKSTLIGRLLHDSKVLYEDHIAAARKNSTEEGGSEIDYSLFTDGLKAEREQGITIDVAYRYFSTPKRKFIIADTPGHVQYTRNMATGASTANLAIVLIDARNGVLSQTKRHVFISSLLGVPHMIVAVNKMDLVDYKEEVFAAIKEDFTEFSRKLDVIDLRFVPISALKGDNVAGCSERMPWYKGGSLLDIMENIHIAGDDNLVDLRFPVQYVLRTGQDFRGYCGQVSSGKIRKGDEILVLPSMKVSRIKSLETYDGELHCAYPPMSVAATLEDELDISRGDVLVHPHNQPRVERHFEGMVVWMGDESMDVNKFYQIKMASRTGRVRIDGVRYMVDVETLSRKPSDALALNEIGRVVFTSTRPMYFDAYRKNKAFGSFILIDSLSNNTVAAGMIIDRQPSESLPTRSGNEGNKSDVVKRPRKRSPMKAGSGKIFISTSTFAEHDDGPLRLLSDNGLDYCLNPHGRKLTEDEIDDILNSGSYAGLVAGTEPLTSNVLKNAKSLKVVSRVGVGLDSVDLEAAKQLNIDVYNTPDVLVDAVAELTLGLILSCLRKIHVMDREMRSGKWKKEMGLLFKGKVLGLIGYGRIGRRVADLSQTFGADILYHDVRKVECKRCKQASLEELLQNSDIISIHASTKEGLLGQAEMQKMKDGVIIINTARGTVVDEDSLYDALSSGKVGLAALDVYSEEPYSGKLLSLDGVVSTPHIGSYAKEARIEMEVQAVQNLLKGL